MADPASEKPSRSPVPAAPGEISMERRLLLAFLLMGLVLFLTPYFYPPASPPARPPVAPAKPAAAARPAAAPEARPAPGQVVADREEAFAIETPLSRVVFSNRGAVVRSWVLKRYKDNDGKLLELVHPGAAKTGYPFAVVFKDPKGPGSINDALFVGRPARDGLGIDFEFAAQGIYARKSFRFRRDSYLVDVASEVVSHGRPQAHVLVWRGGFGDRTVPNYVARLRSIYYDELAAKLVAHEVKEAKDAPLSVSGRFSFAGLEDAYFAAVALAPAGTPLELRTYHDMVPQPDGKESPCLGAGFGGPPTFALFVGPKDMDILRRINPKLEQLVDFGWFAFLAKPLFLSLNWINDRWIHNYGWSIVVVTVIINFLLLPLKFSSLKSMKKMQALAPQIAAINEKYKGISLRDPRRAEQNQEIMELYRKHGVNPMGGCFPLLLQIPFFIAFYKVLTVAIELRGASWLWVTDLSQPEHLPIRILPIAMIVSQFVMQKMTPTTTADPVQQRMLLLMPLVLGFMFYGVSSGLVLYWLTSNLVAIAQQWFFNKTIPAPVVAPPPAPRRKKASRR
ncbi:MAG: membrane protein insertase YidC [Bryobacterales bacterium]|nr:membrane protein insertase YidC [Bryobacteraceae bacterium]MDW8353753.1 membrane protein insertase YidC [Bryobacterales bacterium]